MNHSKAFGHPEIEPGWTSSAKEGIGTAYHTSSCLWFTLSHGIVNEIYFPHVDTPNTRDLQFLITDGETFCHEDRRDLDHEIEYPEAGTSVGFTFQYAEDWVGRNFQVEVSSGTQAASVK